MISIIIPALNEEATIEGVIEKCKKYGDEIIVVDGHSTDKTREIAERCRVTVVVDNGKGKGAAIRQGITLAKSDIIVFIDADGSHDPDDIPKLIDPIKCGEADHVSASRLLGGSSEMHGGFEEFFRLTGAAFITTCINLRFKVRLSDSQNGLRAIRSDVARQLDLRENLTTIEQEMIMKTLKKGFRLIEVPSHEYHRVAGYSKIRLSRVYPRYLYSLIRNLI